MNEVEAWKAEKHGFDVWGDLEAYARAGTPISQIAEADLERMKWYGIFCRDREEDGRYMIRIRIPGCELTAPQARAAAEVARDGDGVVDVTTRGDLQIPGFRISDLPGVAARLETEGLTARQTGHDNVRNVMTHPWAGLDPEELVDVRPLCRALTDAFLGDRQLADLPREFAVAVDGRPSPSARCWEQDTSFVAARRDDGGLAFHWLVAGTQGRDPRPARRLPVWVRERQAPDVLYHALHVFREFGPREARDRAHLRHLVEQIGAAEFLRRVEGRLGYTLDRSDAAAPAARPPEDFTGWFAQKRAGAWALGVAVAPVGLTRGQLDGLADLAESLGDGSLRTAYDQGIVVPNIPAHRKAAAVRGLARLGLDGPAEAIEARPAFSA